MIVVKQWITWVIMGCFLWSPIGSAHPALNIAITGIQGDGLKNIQDSLAINQKLYAGAVDKLTSKNIHTLYRQAESAIRDALKPYGYFAPTIHSTLHAQGERWTATFHIQPGHPVRLKELSITLTGPGCQNKAMLDFIKNLSLKKNDVLVTPNYDATKASLLQLANNQGYLKASWAQNTLQIDLKKRTAIVILQLDTEEQYYFGEVSFGASPLSTHFLKRFIPFQSHDPFSSDTVLALQKNLDNSGYFQSVSIAPEWDRVKDRAVPLHVTMESPKAQRYKIGAGYGSFTGPRLLLSGEWRRLGDSGQHAASLLRLSPVIKGLAFKYFIPGENPLTDQYTIGANMQDFKPDTGHSLSQSVSVAFVKMRSEWQHTVSLNALNERYVLLNQPYRNGHVLYPAYTISHIVADNIVDPHSGKMISINVQGGNRHVLSTTSFVQSEIKAKYIISPTTASRFIVRGDLGYTIVNNLNSLPLTLQYLAGGPGSIRGFPYGSLGPARYLEVGSVEYQYRIMDEIYGAAFCDVGTATNQFNTGFEKTTGVGLVYISAIGPIKVYLTHRLTGPLHSNGVIFSIGPDF